MGPRDKTPQADEPENGEGAPGTPVEQDEMYDEEVADSFPASDPPSAPGIIGPGRSPQKPPGDEP